MSRRITQAEDKVEKVIVELREIARSGDEDERKLAAVERELWATLLALGRALLVLFLARRAGRDRPFVYSGHQGIRYFFDKSKEMSSSIGTLFGKVVFTRPFGRPVSNYRGRADFVVDRELGIVSGFSLSVVLLMAKLSAQMPFARSRSTFRDFLGWAPSPRATLRMVDSTGPLALSFMLQAACPEGDGEVVVIECDAGGNPTITPREYAKRRKPKRKRGASSRESRRQSRKTHEKRTRAKGVKNKNSKAAVIGVVYTLAVKDGIVEGPINKRIIATHESHEKLFEWLEVEAKKRGYGVKKSVFLSDGSEHILERQRRFFPEAIACLDWCHAAEYLWRACSAFHPEGSAKLQNVASRLKSRMLDGDVDGVISTLEDKLARIPKTGPGNKGKRDRLSGAIKYLSKNRKRLRYAELRAAGLPIGSGVVEGTVRNLVRQRLDCSGMRWGLDRCEHVLHLRCLFLNGQWDEFARDLETKTIRLAAQPEPARPYDAKPYPSKAA